MSAPQTPAATVGAGSPDRAAGAAVRIAVVDRDSGFLAVLARRVDAAGWEQRTLAHAPRMEALVAMRLHALVLDLALLGTDARVYLERICAELPELAVIVCTGPSSVGQRVRGLRLGADDWLTKPCHPEELIARVEAVLRRRRRAAAPTTSEPIRSGGLAIRPDQFQAFAGERSVELTRREFELIHLLAEAEGLVLQRDEIYQRVWGYAMAHGDRSVDVFVRKLRAKLEAASPGWRYIHTHFGIGYRFAPEPVDASAVASVATAPPRDPALPADAVSGAAPARDEASLATSR